MGIRRGSAAIPPRFYINAILAGKSARVCAFSFGDKRGLCGHNGGVRGDISWLDWQAFCFF
jgi:hypothetical protein